jgi:hypothetical protein
MTFYLTAKTYSSKIASLPILIEICGFEKITLDKRFIFDVKKFTFNIPMMSGI